MGKYYPFRSNSCSVNPLLNLFVLVLFILLCSSTNGQVTRTWNGGGGDSFWTNRLNWSGTAPLSGNLLLFEGTNGLSPLNTFTSGTVFNGLSFGSTAGAFTLSGYPFGLFGNISNNSAQNQVINNYITLSIANTLSSSGGDLTLNGVISGAFSVTKSGTGLVRLGGQNRFSTRITISDGTLELAGGDNTLAARIPLVVNGGVLDLRSNTQLFGTISGTGGKIKGTGHLIAASTTATSFAGSIGDNDGLNFTKTGTMQVALDLTGTNTTTGIVTVQGGWISSSLASTYLTSLTGLTLTGNGKLGQTSRLNLTGATLRIQNNTSIVSDRVNDAAPIHMQGGGLLYLGSSSASTSETLGPLRLESGQSNISINNPSTSFSSEIIFSELQRTKGAIINLQRMDQTGTRITELGNTGNFPRMLISGTPPVTINGIVPGVFGAERDVMGYVAGSGFGQLGNVTGGFPAYVQYNTNTTLDTSVNATSNILMASTSVDTLTIPANGTTVNTINLRRNDLFFTNDNDVLTLSAGTLMSMGHTEGRLIGTSTIRGVITTPQPELFLFGWNNSGGNMTVNSKLTGNMMVVCGGDGGGGVNFTFTNAGNDYTGGTVLNGSAGSGSTLTLNNTDGLVRIPNAANPDSGLVINDRFTVNMTASQGQIGSANKATLNGNATLTLFGTNTLAGLKFNVYAAPTVNVGTQLTLTGGINVVHSNPQFTATVTAGTLNLNGDNNFPIHIDGLPSGDPMNFVTPISAGLTLASIVANGGISKTGSGVLVLTNASNTFTGAITINAGSVRFNPGANVTSSSSIILNGGGISTRSIANTRTLSFSGGLVLNENGTIELSSSATNTIDFGSCSALAWAAGKTLVIRGWAGTAGATGTFGKVFFGNSSSGLTAAQLSQISFEGFNGGAMLLSTGELVPASNGPYEPMIDRIIAGDGRATVYFFNPDNRGSAITNYQYSTDNGFTWITLSPAVTTSPFTITGLTNGVNYYVRIRAVNANGEGTMSNPETVIPSTGKSRVFYSTSALDVTSSGTGSEILSSGTFVEANRFGTGTLAAVTVNGITFGNSTASMIRPNGPNFQAVWEWNTTSLQTYLTGWSRNSSNTRVANRGWGLSPTSGIYNLMNSTWWINYSGSRSDLVIPGLTMGKVYRLQLISEAPNDAGVYVEDANPYEWAGTNPSVLSITWAARDPEMFMRLSRKIPNRLTGIGTGGEVFFNGYALHEMGVAGSDTTVTACGSFTWQDSTYTASTITSKTITRVGEPDSIVYLDLTIIPITSNTTTASACDSYTWSVDGQTYTQSGSYTSVSGCATSILNLTVTASTTNTTTATACGSYTWAIDGLTYTSSGSYTSVSGCHTEILALTVLNNPTAGITNHSGSTELTCARTSINLEATGGTGYAWSGGLGSNAATSVTSPGTYTVTVTAANGCTGTSSITITQDITAPNAVITNNTGSTELTCSRTSISLTASGGTSYMWSGGLGSNASATATMPFSYMVIVTAANGCTDTETITITANLTPPVATITNNTGSSELTCARTAISLTASGAVSYVWSGGLGSNAGTSATSPATYTVTATASNGCTDTESIIITQDISLPTAVIINNTGNTELTCARTAISLTASGAVSYVWSGGLGSNAGASATSPAIYTVTATASNGCTDTESITITQDITAPTAVITNNTGSTELTCARTAISLTASGAVSYVWSGGLGSNAGASVTSPATYTVTATATNGCTDTENITITQDAKPAVFTLQPSRISQKTTPGIVHPAYSVAVSSGSGHVFQWYSNTSQSNVGGTVISGAQSTSYLPPTLTPGILYYYCTVTTTNGCVGVSQPSGPLQVCGQ